MTKQELELTDEQMGRIDELNNAAHEFLKVLTENPDLEWEQEYIGELIDMAAAFMHGKGFRIHYPAIETDADGTQKRMDFYEPEVLLYGSIRDGAYWNELRFGNPDDGEVPEGFNKYGTRIGSYDVMEVQIWARNREEATEIADNFTRDEIDAYTAFVRTGRRIEAAYPVRKEKA